MLIYKRFLNIALRALTLVSRFLFIFFLARFLQPSALGEYGLITATVGYALYFVGLDFYIFTTRELLKSPVERWGGFIKNQAALSFVLYVILLFLLTGCYLFGVITLEQASWFFFILLFEHVNQELSRIFVAINNQNLASVLLFLRQGLWAIIVVIVMAAFPATRNLTTVLTLWALSGVLTFALGVIHLKKIGMGGWQNQIDLKWIKLGVKTSGIFLLATLSIRGTQTLDRFWIQSMNGLDVVGAYVLFAGMTSALMAFLDAGVFTYSYPMLIKLSNEGEERLFRQHLFKMAGATIIFILFFVVISLIVMPYLLAWTGKVLYFDYVVIYKWLLVATVLNALGMIPHYALYARHFDKPIIYSHLSSVPVFILSTWILSQWNHIVAVPAGLVFSFLFILIWKTVAYYIVKKSHK
ncbi:lipopolysaccharide biosynthesis protein [Pantoea sp. FN0302]|uniref:lipopolysaccharide biosynthesis protein n=1 Tax=Pantoea sp. FN0302 TaxID=3418558 RepID=UPI003CF50686